MAVPAINEECLAGQSLRAATASALTEGALLVIEKREMFRLLHGSAPIADWFLSLTLARLRRIEDDLADQRCNPGEKRLARALLLLARDGKHGEKRILPKLSQTMLAGGNLTVTHALRRVVDERVAWE